MKNREGLKKVTVPPYKRSDTNFIFQIGLATIWFVTLSFSITNHFRGCPKKIMTGWGRYVIGKKLTMCKFFFST